MEGNPSGAGRRAPRREHAQTTDGNEHRKCEGRRGENSAPASAPIQRTLLSREGGIERRMKEQSRVQQVSDDHAFRIDECKLDHVLWVTINEMAEPKTKEIRLSSKGLAQLPERELL
jgi:hypothetical protein